MNAENLQLITVLRNQLHSCPELALHEEQTRNVLKTFLAEHASVTIVDHDLWFYAVLGQKGADETIAFRADFDAIASKNGNAHLCGHDGHAACLCGLILELEEMIKANEVVDVIAGTTGGQAGDEAADMAAQEAPCEAEHKTDAAIARTFTGPAGAAPKNYIFLFQPGEEDGSGAALCTPLFNEVKIDRMYAQHNMPGIPFGVIYTRPGVLFSASEGFSIFIEGLQSHASEPHVGKNPAYILSELALQLQPLTQFTGFGHPYHTNELEFSDMTLCTIVGMKIGEGKFGVSPAQGEMHLTLRATTSADVEKLKTYISEFIATRCEAEGMTYRFAHCDIFPDTSNDTELAHHALSCCKQAGFVTQMASEPFAVSEDFGYLSKAHGRCCYYVVGAGKDFAPLHSEAYEFPDELIEPTVDSLVAVAVSEFSRYVEKDVSLTYEE